MPRPGVLLPVPPQLPRVPSPRSPDGAVSGTWSVREKLGSPVSDTAAEEELGDESVRRRVQRRQAQQAAKDAKPAGPPWWDGFGKSPARSDWAKAPRRLTSNQFGGLQPSRPAQIPLSARVASRSDGLSGGSRRRSRSENLSPGPGAYKDKPLKQSVGGFIAPPQGPTQQRRGVRRPYWLHTDGSGVPLVHTTGGIDNAHKTSLHTPGPGCYNVAPPWAPTEAATGVFLKGSRRIETHAGRVDLFCEWHAPGPGTYFPRMDEASFAGRDRTMRAFVRRRAPHTVR
eukprot:TRINITY_DN32025_c0_g1_i1.p1 TRINITY_DN32025_c0_g1~~TRINITY_DN32025_c0_g1_i1.p1  ORF type:complete len:285 (+),score=37.67 TRINITY_DN32025_c0_g1_i1:105-959(+)